MWLVVVSRVTRCSFGGAIETSAAAAVMHCLDWLAKEQSKSYFKREDKERYLVRFEVFFKDKDSYITDQGWVLGTECWVCRLETYDRTDVLVCRATLDDCLQEAVRRIQTYLSGDNKWWCGINQEEIDEHFGA